MCQSPLKETWMNHPRNLNKEKTVDKKPTTDGVEPRIWMQKSAISGRFYKQKLAVLNIQCVNKMEYHDRSVQYRSKWELRSVEMHCHFSAHLKKVHLLDKGCHEFRPSLFFVFFPRRIEMVWQDLTCFTTFSYATSSLHSGAAICTHIERIYDVIWSKRLKYNKWVGINKMTPKKSLFNQKTSEI